MGGPRRPGQQESESESKSKSESEAEAETETEPSPSPTLPPTPLSPPVPSLAHLSHFFKKTNSVPPLLDIWVDGEEVSGVHGSGRIGRGRGGPGGGSSSAASVGGKIAGWGTVTPVGTRRLSRLPPLPTLSLSAARGLVDLYSAVWDALKKTEAIAWALGGTALGAIRHGGQIPWDDDRDIGVFASDLPNLLAALRGDERVQVIAPSYGLKVLPAAASTTQVGPFIDVFAMSLMPQRADARNLERKVANQRRALVFASCLRSSKPGARERCEEEAAKVKEEQLLVMDSRTARGVWPADRENLIASRMHRLAEMPFGRATVRSNVWLPGTVEERVAYLDRKFSCDWRVRGRLNFAHSVDCPVSALHARKMGLGQLELFDDALLYAAPDGEGDTDLASLFPWQGEREGEEVGGAPTCPADSIVPRPDPMAWHSTASRSGVLSDVT